MRLTHPFQNAIAQSHGQRPEFLDFAVAGDAGRFVNSASTLGSERLQRIDDCAVVADGQPKGFNRLVVCASALGSFVPSRFQRHGRALQGGVVGNGESPVTVDLRVGAGGQVALDDGEQAGDLLAAGLVRPKPAVLLPIVKAHARLRQEKPSNPA